MLSKPSWIIAAHYKEGDTLLTLTVAWVDPVCCDEVPFCEELCRLAAMLAYIRGEEGREKEGEEGRWAIYTLSDAPGSTSGVPTLSWAAGVDRPAARRPGSAAVPSSGCAAAAGPPSAASDAAAGRRTSAAGTAPPCSVAGAAPAGTPAHKHAHKKLVNKTWTILMIHH